MAYYQADQLILRGSLAEENFREIQITLFEVTAPQTSNQMIHSQQQRPSIALHAVHDVLLQWFEWRFVVASQELAQANNHVKRRAQFMSHRLDKLRLGAVRVQYSFF